MLALPPCVAGPPPRPCEAPFYLFSSFLFSIVAECSNLFFNFFAPDASQRKGRGACISYTFTIFICRQRLELFFQWENAKPALTYTVPAPHKLVGLVSSDHLQDRHIILLFILWEDHYCVHKKYYALLAFGVSRHAVTAPATPAGWSGRG